MNDTVKLPGAPEAEVTDFVARVRERLSDLSEDEREELVGGLEGDLAELQADGGSVRELGDPRAYADELRAAAGVTARSAPPVGSPRRRAAEALGDVLDRAHRGWEELVSVPPLDSAWGFLVTLRPVWWCLRAWAALQLLDIYVGSGDRSTLVPDLGHAPVFGLVLTLAAVLTSVQIGRGRWWPGHHLSARPGRRLLLLALNVFALLVTPMLLARVTGPSASAVESVATPAPGLTTGGAYVENVFPYDAQGRPLTGVQLFDQDGRPLRVNPGGAFAWDGSGEGGTAVYPWLSAPAGRAAFNVFPLPERRQAVPDVDADSWDSARPPRLPEPPLVSVPTASLPTTAAAPSAPRSHGDGDTPVSQPRR